MERCRVLSVGIVLLWAGAAAAQSPAPVAAKTVAKSCSIVTGMGQSKADVALAERRYADAEQLYAKSTSYSPATVGLMRALTGQQKLAEALALALNETAAHPDDALLLDGLGEVRFRRGEVEEAAAAYTRSTMLDGCAARTHYDISRYQDLRGRYKSAALELDQAHRLSPADPLITRSWEQMHRTGPTAEQRVARLREQQAAADKTDAQKASIEKLIKRVESEGKGDCELVSHSGTAKFDMKPMGNLNTDSGNQGVGLDVLLNGSRRRLELDTGASGLVLFQQAAKSLGLETEAELQSGGIGDAGLRTTSETHVDSIKIGPMEFHNCMVRVIEAKNIMAGQDGLIGSDVFRNFRITLDFPGMEVRLAPLPKRPDAAETTASLGTESEDRAGSADNLHDPFVAPDMAKWTPIFRNGHDMIVPTTIGKVPKKLFLLDSGAGLNSISPDAAREVTGLETDENMHVRGISGEVKNVQATGPITVQFANMRMQTLGMTAFGTESLSRSLGVEISGIIGFPILRLLVFEIDYRDNLIHVTYEPHVTLGR